MEKKINQSYSKREDALFTKMESRRMRRWFNNELSEIDSKEEIWLIIFRKPYNPKSDWMIKFWVWDSNKNEIRGENILHGIINPEGKNPSKYYLSGILTELYIDRTYEKIVFRPEQSKSYYIFDYTGKLVHQTENITKSIIEDKNPFSKFLNKNLFFTKIEKKIEIYKLEEIIDGYPKSIQLLWQSNIHIEEEKFTILFEDKYWIICASDKCIEVPSGRTNTIWIYNNKEDGKYENWDFKLKISIKEHIGNFRIKKENENLRISFQEYEKGILKEEIKSINLPESILM